MYKIPLRGTDNNIDEAQNWVRPPGAGAVGKAQHISWGWTELLFLWESHRDVGLETSSRSQLGWRAGPAEGSNAGKAGISQMVAKMAKERQ